VASEQRPSSRVGDRAAEAAALLAFASAAVSVFWALGGTWLLDTVGGEMERYARERSAGALVLITVVVLLKVVAGLLALGLRAGDRSRSRSRIRPRLLLLGNGAACVILLLWGAANVGAGALILADVIEPSATTDLHALRWHVFLWDLWFLVWGLALALALLLWRRQRRVDAGGSVDRATGNGFG
jgi:hypothetical protein